MVSVISWMLMLLFMGPVWNQNPNSTTFEPATTYTLLLECKGDSVVAQIAGKEPLKATAPDFHVKKPGLVFRMGGKDGQEVAFDNVRVWALK